jgi:DNA-binding CsgD family transcriptional regulator
MLFIDAIPGLGGLAVEDAAQLALAGDSSDRTAAVALRALADLEPGDRAWHAAVWALVVCDRYDAARRELERAGHRPAALAVRAELALRTGALALAEADARALRSRELPFGADWQGEVLIERGELAHAERLEPAAGPWGPLTRGRLRLAQGRAADAVAELRECGRLAGELGIVNPAVLPWRSRLAEALGRSDEARRLAGEELRLAHRFGAPRAIGVALRAAAGAAGGTYAVPLLREAVALLEDAPLEAARANAALGSALRRSGDPQAAREPLRLAVDAAHHCGARALEDEALEELRAAGARPRRPRITGAGALTPSERRVAELAAAGRQNREIAATLHVTLSTVEFHLRNVYRKLAIASRRELAATLKLAAPRPRIFTRLDIRLV